MKKPTKELIKELAELRRNQCSVLSRKILMEFSKGKIHPIVAMTSLMWCLTYIVSDKIYSKELPPGIMKKTREFCKEWSEWKEEQNEKDRSYIG